jgi:hypothetical protein
VDNEVRHREARTEALVEVVEDRLVIRPLIALRNGDRCDPRNGIVVAPVLVSETKFAEDFISVLCSRQDDAVLVEILRAAGIVVVRENTDLWTQRLLDCLELDGLALPPQLFLSLIPPVSATIGHLEPPPAMDWS